MLASARRRKWRLPTEEAEVSTPRRGQRHLVTAKILAALESTIEETATRKRSSTSGSGGVSGGSNNKVATRGPSACVG
jgi:hypothetical protein